MMKIERYPRIIIDSITGFKTKDDADTARAKIHLILDSWHSTQEITTHTEEEK